MAPLTYSIRELADEFSVTTRAIRFYESKGLITPKRNGQQRIFSQGDRAKLKMILRGKRLGFSLDEITHLLALYDTPKDSIPQLQRYLERLLEHKYNLLVQRADLEKTLAEMEEAETDCRLALSRAYRR